MTRLIAALSIALALGCGTSPQDPVEEEDPFFLTLDVVNNSLITVDIHANTDSAMVDPTERHVIAVQDPLSGNMGLFVQVIWPGNPELQAELLADGAVRGEHYEVVVTDVAAHLFLR